MNTYLSTKSRLFLGVIVIASVAVTLLGCKPITSADISGTYFRTKDGISDQVILASDGTFQQTVTFTNGQSWKTSGSWKFNGEFVQFNSLYESFEIETGARAVATVPPQMLSDMFLEVQKGKLLRNSVEPIWTKQQPALIVSP